MRFPSPTDPRPSRAEVLLGYLDYFRSVVLDKLDGLSEADLNMASVFPHKATKGAGTRRF